MRLPRTADTRSSRTPLAITALMLCALCAALPAAAQTTGVIAFRDDCTGILYAMRGNGSGRTVQGARCPACEGSGKIVRGIGGA